MIKCVGVKKFNDLFRNEYVMSLFMGLNESFAGVRSHVLLMDPLQTIYKV